jgi:hypothetical protein
MANHMVYTSIVQAIRNGQLNEPFTPRDFRLACPGLGVGTYNVFLHKHRIGNPSGTSELFEKNEAGKFRLVRPFLYDL